jgi:hypothetical protein
MSYEGALKNSPSKTWKNDNDPPTFALPKNGTIF